MFLSLMIFLRVFSESIPSLSAVLGIIILLMAALLLFPFGNLKMSMNGHFFQLILVYATVNFLWVFVGIAKHGSALLLPGIYDSLKPFSVLCLFYLVNSDLVISNAKIQGLTRLLLFTYATAGYVGLVMVNLGLSRYLDGQYRAQWPTAHPNSLGIVLGLLLVFVVATRGIYRNKLMDCFVLLGLFVGLFATKSLSAIVVSLIGLIAFLSFKISIKYFFVITISTIALMVSAPYLIGDRLGEISLDLSRYYDLWNYNYRYFDSSLEWRIVNWRGLFDQFCDSYLLGHGTCGWMVVNPFRTRAGPLGGFEPHSEIFKWLVQYGLLGTTLLVAFTLRSIVSCGKSVRSYNKNAATSCVLLAMLIGGFLGKQLMYLPLLNLVVIFSYYEASLADSSREGKGIKL